MPSGRLVNEADARLRAWMDSAAHKAGTRLPSERALAVELGVQHYALNRAMARLIAEGRVERDGYKLFVGAPRKETQEFTCHLVVAQRSIYLPSYKRIAKEMGIKLVLHSWQSTDEAILVLDQLDRPDTEAIVFDPPYAAPASVWAPIAHRLSQHGIPFVSLGQPEPHIYSVLSANAHDVQLALDHLIELGHREIGFVTAPPTNPISTEILYAWESLCRQRQLPGSEKRVHLQNNARLREEADEVAGLLTGPWSAATALVLYSGLEYNIDFLQERLAQRGRPVPDNLSLVFIGGARPPAVARPPVTSVAIDMPLMQETAYYLAQRATRKKNHMGILPPACCVRIQSQLVVRSSTQQPAALADRPAPKALAHPAEAAPAVPRPPAELARSLEASLRKPYSLAARASLAETPRFAPVDLGSLVNRPLNFRRGWLGDLPLKNFLPGAHEIHGVPFNILGGARRADCGALVFHSSVNTTGNAQRLPDKVRIPIHSKVAAIYVLHGCGYAKFAHPFANYRFFSGKTCLDNVPLVSLGQPPPDYHASTPGPGLPTPNIQDWWPDFPHMDFPHARMAPILESEPGSPLPKHVYLYTFEWINPRPEKKVDCLEITVDSAQSTTLGVLGVTVLKPAGR